MKTCCVVLTFKSVDKILRCDHLNETSSAVHLHGTICFSIIYKLKFENFLKFLFANSIDDFKRKLKSFLFMRAYES